MRTFFPHALLSILAAALTACGADRADQPSVPAAEPKVATTRAALVLDPAWPAGSGVTGSSWPNETLTALNSIELAASASVTGDVGVITAATGPVLATGFELALNANARVTGNVRADSLSVRGNAVVTGNAGYNQLDGIGTIQGTRTTPLSLPLAITVPAFPSFTAGTTTIEVPVRADQTLAPGNYGMVRLRAGSSSDKTVLSLSGGIYNIADLELAAQARVECVAACEIRIKNRIAGAANSELGPRPGGALDLRDVRVFVEGRNGGTGVPNASPAALSMNASGILRGFVFVPNGTLQLRANVVATGRLVARDLALEANAVVEAGGTTVLPPVIQTQPASVTVFDGQPATFQVSVSGSALTFQWERNRVAIPGATQGVYTLASARLTDNNSRFRVVVSNAAGSVTSAEATLTVQPEAPTITQHPTPLTVTEGQSASFTCAASGTNPSYAWQKDGADIPGATQATYTIPAAAASHAGDYRCQASNSAGSALSNPARLTVILHAPQITTHPQSLSVLENLAASFECAASGSQVTYRWQKDGQDIPSATGPSFTLPHVAYGDQGSYRCIAHNSSDDAASNPATLTVQLRPPQITLHPSDASVAEGGTASLTCAASGTNVVYEWQNSAGTLVATGPDLTVGPATYVHQGTYACVASNSGGFAQSLGATLTVVLTAPNITEHPSPVTVTEDSAASFTCAASGTLVSYQWQKDAHDIPGATQPTFSIATVSYADAGDYRCIARNNTSSATSHSAALTVNLRPPIVIHHPEDVDAVEGEAAHFTCDTSGTNVTYQWQKDGQPITGATQPNFTIASVRLADRGSYRCIAHNTGHDVASNPATLTVILLAPVITQQPAPLTVEEGESAHFTCAASGTNVTYQWQKDEVDIESAVGPSYEIAAVTYDHGAEYRCIAQNTTTSVASDHARLTIRLKPPVITQQPANVSVTEGQPATFTCLASGTHVTYEWRNSAGGVVGTGPSFTLAATTYAMADSYHCIAQNTSGSAESSPATLTVALIAPQITAQPEDLTATERTAATFTCGASGTNVSYRWQTQTTDIPGATDPTYTLTSVTVDDAGSYRCIAQNTGGIAESRAAELVVALIPPEITTQPASLTVIENHSASFTCAASGTHVSYRWLKNGQPIADATLASFTIPISRHADEGSYHCVAENSGGQAASEPASLAVTLIAPTITEPPQDATVTEGDAASFTCAASGTNVTYRWLKGTGVDAIQVGTGNPFSISAVRFEDSGSYRCEARNTTSAVTSQLATLTVGLIAPTIAQHPEAVTATEYQPASFTCAATGTNVSYQWQKDEVDIPGATLATYAIAAVQATDAAEYRCLGRNTTAIATSNPARLTVTLLPPVILQQPSDVTATEGEPASFTCSASGTAVTYKWQKDGADIPDATEATYTIDPVAHTHAGDYRCIAHNSNADATSNAAKLTVELLPPVITRQPANVTVAEGQAFTVSVEATGTLLTYQWQRNGLSLQGATGSSFTKPAALSDDASLYRVIVSNTGNDVPSDPATITLQDDVAPTLSLSTPAEVTLTGDHLAIRGSANDNSSHPLQTTLTSTRFDGQSFDAVLNPDGSFESDIPLQLGENVITITVRDHRGNTTTKTITVIVTAAEQPSILISEPAHGSTVQTDRIRVRGVVRSTRPAEELRISLGNDVQFPTGQGPDYAFDFQNVRLVQGPNLLTISVQTPAGTVHQQLTVTRGSGSSATTPIPPRITLQVAQPELYVQGATFTVAGSVAAQRCVQSVRINGVLTPHIGSGLTASFSKSLSFTELGTDHATVQVSATDCDGLTSNAGYVVHRDDGAPLITIDNLQPAPSVNRVTDTPYRLTGRVTEQNLAGLSIAGQSLGVLPIGDSEWSFAIDVPLSRQTDRQLQVEAWDHAGNRTTRDLIVHLDSPIELELLAPVANTQRTVSGSTTPLEVVARAIGMADTDTVTASFDAEPPVLLTRNGNLASAELAVPATAGTHTVTVRVLNAQSGQLAARSATFSFITEESVALEVIAQEPATDAIDVEANAPVTLRFSKPIDPQLLGVAVFETVHGKIYQDPALGSDILRQSAIELTEVHREHEAVPGNALNFPGNRMFTFYPSRDYGYGGEVLVEVTYDGSPLWHSRFQIRRLPTLIHGFVTDHLLTPLEGIVVHFPEVDRTATTDAEGNWNLGFGEPAEAMLPAGRYRVLINPAMNDPHFGTGEAFIDVNAEQLNRSPLIAITRIEASEPFHALESRQSTAAAFDEGDLELELSGATLTFADGQGQGSVHAQFATASETGMRFLPSAYAQFGYVLNPGGVAVGGELGMRMRLPRRENSFAYVDDLPERVLLVGRDPNSLLVVPAGVGRIDKQARTVTSEGPTHFQRLDFIGVSTRSIDPQLLANYATGQLSLTALTSALENAP